jgi:hypothetical protein
LQTLDLASWEFSVSRTLDESLLKACNTLNHHLLQYANDMK